MPKGSKKVIGEGGYGCVIAPSLECEQNGQSNIDIDYKNKVSKVMTTKHANAELLEYETISKIDKKKQFYLGKPTICKPKDTPENNAAIQKCDIENILADSPFDKSTPVNMDELSLLIMKNGGLNLEDYADKMATQKPNLKNKQKMAKFWAKVYTIILGIKNLLNNRTIHRDMKGQNIVYDDNKNRINFIDFGLMQNYDQLQQDILDDKADPIVHWSYPLETRLTDKKMFNYFSDLSTEQQKRIDLFENITEMYQEDEKGKVTESKFGKAISHFCQAAYADTRTDEKELDKVQTAVYREYFEFVCFDIQSRTFEEFVTRHLDTFDIYGLGIGCMYVLTKTRHVMDDPILYSKLDNLFRLMITKRLFQRITIDKLIQQYGDIVSQHLSTFSDINNAKKHVSKHVKIRTRPSIINKSVSYRSRHRRRSQNKTRKSLTKCSPGQVRNSVSKECIEISKGLN